MTAFVTFLHGRGLRAGAALLCLWLVAAFAVFAEVAVPPVARVTDQTGTLSAEQKRALEQKLAAFEQAKGSQIAILIVPSTEPETIEQYSIRVAEQWKLGRKGVDDGVLMVVARNDRTIRFEVGYGLEGAVPDAIAHRVIDEIIVPRFREGDYYGGLDAGVDQLIKLVDGEPLPPPPEGGSDNGMEAVVPLLFFVLVGAQMLRRVFGSGLGALLAGGAVFTLVWLVSGLLVVALFFGVVALLFTLLGGAVPMGGGWSSRGGGGFGGGGFGGGGFGGGGGGFGGGGASGRW